MELIPFIIFVLAASFHAFKFHASLKKVVRIWRITPEVEVCKAKFKAYGDLCSDIAFLNNLWLGTDLVKVPEQALRNELIVTRRHFRLQFIFGICSFISIVFGRLFLVG